MVFMDKNGKGKNIFKDLDVKNVVFEKTKSVPNNFVNGKQMNPVKSDLFHSVGKKKVVKL